MNLSLWIERLKTEVPALLIVAGAAEYAALRKSNMVPRKMPAAYVVPASEVGGPNQLINAFSQNVEESVAVIYALRNLTDPRGEAAQSDMETVREPGFTALLGWQPTAGHDIAEFVRGDLLDFTDQVLWWQDQFRSGIYRRKT